MPAVAVALGTLVAMAIVVFALHRHRCDDLSPSVRNFADFRACLAEAEQGRVPPTR